MRALPVHPIGTPTNGISPNTGPLATAAWLLARGLASPDPRWFLEVTLDVSRPASDGDETTQLRIELYSEEWGFWLRRDGKVSWVRVTDVPFVHGRDEHALLRDTPALKNIGRLVRALEERFGVQFDRGAPSIRTSLVDAEPAVREWIASWSAQSAPRRGM